MWGETSEKTHYPARYYCGLRSSGALSESLSLSPATYLPRVLVDDAGDAFVVDLVDKYLYVQSHTGT